MWPHSTLYEQAVRFSLVGTATAIHRNLITGVQTTLEISGGQVTIDSSSNVRRKLDMTLPADDETWDALNTVGGEITCTRTVQYVNGQRETLPLGVFIVDQDTMSHAVGGTINLSAPDRWGKVQKVKLPPTGRGSVASNAAYAEIKRLIEGAWNATYPFPGWAQYDTTATAKVGIQLWDDGSREAAMLGICKGNSLDLCFNAQGQAVLRPIPVMTSSSTPVWIVDEGRNGVVVSADESRDRTRIFNAVEVSPGSPDIIFNTVVVQNTTVGDSLSVNGPLGYQPLLYSDPSIRSSQQARSAGLTQLQKVSGAAKQISFGSLVNDSLDVFDIIGVQLQNRDLELHVIDSLVIPLTDDGTPMTGQTRSTIDPSLGL